MTRFLLGLAIALCAFRADAQTRAEMAAKSVKVSIHDYAEIAPTFATIKMALLNTSSFWLTNINIRCEFLDVSGAVVHNYRHQAKGEIAPGKALVTTLAFAELPRSAKDARCVATSAEGASPL